MEFFIDWRIWKNKIKKKYNFSKLAQPVIRWKKKKQGWRGLSLLKCVWRVCDNNISLGEIYILRCNDELCERESSSVLFPKIKNYNVCNLLDKSNISTVYICFATYSNFTSGNGDGHFFSKWRGFGPIFLTTRSIPIWEEALLQQLPQSTIDPFHTPSATVLLFIDIESPPTFIRLCHHS
jgi:hypothetical protein